MINVIYQKIKSLIIHLKINKIVNKIQFIYNKYKLVQIQKTSPFNSLKLTQKEYLKLISKQNKLINLIKRFYYNIKEIQLLLLLEVNIEQVKALF